MRIILLEHPRKIAPERCNDIANTPLSSCLLSGYAAGMLRSMGHEVEIIEGHMDGLCYEEITRRVTAMRPEMIGVHMIYHWRPDVELYAFLDLMKREFDPHISVYGFYPTIIHEEILKACSAIDSVVLGEPEITFAELARTLEARKCPAEIRGLAQRGPYNCGIRYERREPIADIDALPFPARTKGMYKIPEVNIQGSRGCYGRCVFCYINPFYGRPSLWRERSPENIIKEIDAIISETGRRDFYFTDPNFFGPGERGRQRTLRLAELLRQRNIRFGLEGRVNDIHDETIGALADAGLRNILIGLESGKDDALKRMNKMTTVAQNEQALLILRTHGIEPNVGFIMFEPDSSLEDVRANFEFLQRNGLLKTLAITANVLYHFQIVLKGTPAYQNLYQAGRLQTSREAPYEGTATFLQAGVGLLASAMRRLTNFIFARMNDIWSGRVVGPPGANARYSRVNVLLVDTFDRLLTRIETAGHFSADDMGLLVTDAEKKICAILEGAVY
jgi:radical SAM superfamily enzyme YgiQ (UPF0313 family)